MPQQDAGFAGWDADIGVQTALAAARDGIDAVLRDRGLRRTAPAMTAASLLRGAAASAQLDGSTCVLADLEAGEADQIAAAAARMNAELPSLIPVIQRAPLQAFARLHASAAAGSVPDDAVGRPRGPAEAERLRNLAAELQRAADIPGLAVAALAHAELHAAQPFAIHNGLVARAVERLLLVARGIDPACVLVPEAGHLARAEHYRAALAAYAADQAAGRTRWLLYAADAYSGAAAESPLADRSGRG